MKRERWRIVRAFPHYEVSDRGRVRRRVGGQGARKGHVLRPALVSGYCLVSLYGDDGPRTVRIHTLVATAFIRPLRRGEEVNHKNDRGHDNRLTNLEIVTKGRNLALQSKHGRNVRGEKHPSAKLSAANVIAIRTFHKMLRYGTDVLATQFGVSRRHVQAIIARRYWRSV